MAVNDSTEQATKATNEQPVAAATTPFNFNTSQAPQQQIGVGSGFHSFGITANGNSAGMIQKLHKAVLEYIKVNKFQYIKDTNVFQLLSSNVKNIAGDSIVITMELFSGEICAIVLGDCSTVGNLPDYRVQVGVQNGWGQNQTKGMMRPSSTVFAQQSYIETAKAYVGSLLQKEVKTAFSISIPKNAPSDDMSVANYISQAVKDLLNLVNLRLVGKDWYIGANADDSILQTSEAVNTSGIVTDPYGHESFATLSVTLTSYPKNQNNSLANQDWDPNGASNIPRQITTAVGYVDVGIGSKQVSNGFNQVVEVPIISPRIVLTQTNVQPNTFNSLLLNIHVWSTLCSDRAPWISHFVRRSDGMNDPGALNMVKKSIGNGERIQLLDPNVPQQQQIELLGKLIELNTNQVKVAALFTESDMMACLGSKFRGLSENAISQQLTKDILKSLEALTTHNINRGKPNEPLVEGSTVPNTCAELYGLNGFPQIALGVERVLVGYWTDSNGNRRSLQEIDLIYLLNAFANDLGVANSWQKSFNKGVAGLIERQDIINHVTKGTAVITDIGTLVTFDSRFIALLAKTISAAGWTVRRPEVGGIEFMSSEMPVTGWASASGVSTNLFSFNQLNNNVNGTIGGFGGNNIWN